MDCNTSQNLIQFNVIVINGGGDGSIPIPIIKGELAYHTPAIAPAVDIGFYGSLDHGPRKRILAEGKNILRSITTYA